MKHLILTLSLITTVLTSNAQVKIALTGGLNIASISWKDKDATNTLIDSADYAFGSTKSKQGFNVALLFEIHTEENFYLETGIGLSKKGGETRENIKLTPSGVQFNRTQIFSPTYLQVPAYLIYFPENKRKYKFTAGAGAQIGFGVGGRYQSTTFVGTNPKKQVDQPISYGINLNDQFAKIEIGIGAKVGFIISDNLCFGASYQRSIINNAPKTMEQLGSAIHSVIGFHITKFIKR